ncbi:hypothetical protein QR680_018708 [Steinernema hermaphroditum]|uniref:Uncharacterized protein n=1 Tax=Steinernema hermaphroditum TaxID=289476 RepID=A0AA39HJR2_9BILA|nr:hypothetical protein QR680_018708 [Steinernema hermaphroditum]
MSSNSSASQLQTSRSALLSVEKHEIPSPGMAQFLWNLVLSELKSEDGGKDPSTPEFWLKMKNRHLLTQSTFYYIKHIWVMWDNDFLPGVSEEDRQNLLLPVLGDRRADMTASTTASTPSRDGTESATKADEQRTPPSRQPQRHLFFKEDEVKRLWRIVIAELRRDEAVNPTAMKFWAQIKASSLYARDDLWRTATAYTRRMKRAWEEMDFQGLDSVEQEFLETVIKQQRDDSCTYQMPPITQEVTVHDWTTSSIEAPKPSPVRESVAPENPVQSRDSFIFTNDEILKLWRIVLTEKTKDGTANFLSATFWARLSTLYPWYDLWRSPATYAARMKKLWEEKNLYGLSDDEQLFLRNLMRVHPLLAEEDHKESNNNALSSSSNNNIPTSCDRAEDPSEQKVPTRVYFSAGEITYLWRLALEQVRTQPEEFQLADISSIKFWTRLKRTHPDADLWRSSVVYSKKFARMLNNENKEYGNLTEVEKLEIQSKLSKATEPVPAAVGEPCSPAPDPLQEFNKLVENLRARAPSLVEEWVQTTMLLSNEINAMVAEAIMDGITKVSSTREQDYPHTDDSLSDCSPPRKKRAIGAHLIDEATEMKALRKSGSKIL